MQERYTGLERAKQESTLAIATRSKHAEAVTQNVLEGPIYAGLHNDIDLYAVFTISNAGCELIETFADLHRHLAEKNLSRRTPSRVDLELPYVHPSHSRFDRPNFGIKQRDALVANWMMCASQLLKFGPPMI